MTKEGKIYTGEKTVSSMSGVRRTGQLHIKYWHYNTFKHNIKKRKSKWIKDQNVRLDTIKLLEESKSTTPFDRNHSSIFWGSSPRVMEIKIKTNKWDLIKIKSFCTAKEMINEEKRQHTEWEKIFANEATSKELICKITNSS